MLKHEINYVSVEYTRIKRYLNGHYSKLDDVHVDKPDELNNFDIQALLHLKDCKSFISVLLCCLYYNRLDVSINIDNSNYNNQRFYHSLVDITLNNMNCSISSIVDKFIESKSNILDKYHCYKITNCEVNERLLKCFKVFDDMNLFDESHNKTFKKFIKTYDEIINKVNSVVY